MARGWESKSVEAQQAQAAEDTTPSRPHLTAKQAAQLRAKEGLLLSRQRILHELRATHHPRHRQMLEQALSELDIRLAKLN
jgi:hypothetical protein